MLNSCLLPAARAAAKASRVSRTAPSPMACTWMLKPCLPASAMNAFISAGGMKSSPVDLPGLPLASLYGSSNAAVCVGYSSTPSAKSLMKSARNSGSVSLARKPSRRLNSSVVLSVAGFEGDGDSRGELVEFREFDVGVDGGFVGVGLEITGDAGRRAAAAAPCAARRGVARAWPSPSLTAQDPWRCRPGIRWRRPWCRGRCGRRQDLACRG